MPPPSSSLNKRGKKPANASKKISSKPSSQATQPSPQALTQQATPTPSWFSWAIAEPCESVKVPVEDMVETPSQHTELETVDIHCLRWGSSKTKRGLVFVHGGGANAFWYKFVGAFFANEFDVVAITNSGNGDSGHRKQCYTMKNWSYEILACCEKLGLLTADRPRPFIVAHSLGTYVTINLLRGVDFPPEVCDKFGGVILADGAIRPYALSKTIQERVLQIRSKDPNLKPREQWPVNPPTVSPLARFKLRPFQECDNIYIVRTAVAIYFYWQN
jgi:pimeloyl-ACP methyl ester carboxylesterase